MCSAEARRHIKPNLFEAAVFCSGHVVAQSGVTEGDSTLVCLRAWKGERVRRGDSPGMPSQNTPWCSSQHPASSPWQWQSWAGRATQTSAWRPLQTCRPPTAACLGGCGLQRHPRRSRGDSWQPPGSRGDR